MRVYHLHYLLIVFVMQCLLTFASLRLYFSDFKSAERLVTTTTYILPLFGYFAAFWTAAPFNRCGPLVRTFSVTIFTIAALTGASFILATYFYYFGLPF